jgi:hypothetical protein
MSYAPDSICCPGDDLPFSEGTGYWDLSVYPWGGSFHRLDKWTVTKVERVVDRYTNDMPRRVVVILPNGKKAGFQL